MSTILTNTGLAKIAAALAANSSVPLDKIAIGDGSGSPVTPVATQTALVHEVYRQSINSLRQDPNYANVLIAEVTIPASVGPWTMREVGLIDTTGALIAVGSTQVTEKPDPSGGSASTIIVRMAIKVSDASAVSLTIDPSTVIATRSWVIDLLYPVGEVLFTRRAGNPSTWLGGTWARYGAGKLLALYDAAQTEFNALDKTGGAKTHTLARANLPTDQIPVAASGNTSTDGSHVHNNGTGDCSGPGSTTGGGFAFIQQAGNGGGAQTGAAGSHSHTVSVTGQTEALGSATPVNNLPPYTTVFAWQRTA